MPTLDSDPISEQKHSIELDADEFHLIFHSLRLAYAVITEKNDVMTKELTTIYFLAEDAGYNKSMNLERKLRLLHREICPDAPEVTDPPKE